MKSSIASRLFRKVFLFYLLVATAVVGTLVFKEYSDTKKQIIKKLEGYGQSQSIVLAESLWAMDTAELQLIIDELIQDSQIVGVKILDHNKQEVLARAGQTTVLDGNGSRLSHVLYWHTFAIDIYHETGSDRVGFAELFTSRGVIFEVIKFRIMLVIVSVLIMIIALWIILHSVSRVILSTPLNRLTTLTKNLDLSNLDDYCEIDTPGGNNELDVLQNAFVSMVHRLSGANKELSELHNDLENLVEKRTALLNQEIKERKQIEKEVLTQGAIVTHMLDGAYLVRVNDGIIVYTNKAFESMFGYQSGEMLGQHISIVNGAKDKSSIEISNEIHQALAINKKWQGEVLNIKKNGTSFWSYVTIVTIIHPEFGEVWVSINADISYLKRQEAELIKAKDDAEAATVAKSNFLSTMSHEIRTPMNGVLGMTQLLEDTALDDEQKSYLNTIISSGNSLLNVINDILDFSKLDTQKVELEHINFDLELVCYDCMKLVSVTALKKGVDLILDYYPDCPRMWVGDPSRIRQVLLNLLGNAIKFTSSGYVRLGVRGLLEESGRQLVRLEVEDSGIGIKPEAIKHLFDHFTQADQATTRKYGGTGLGLAITKKLVTLMKGQLGVDSTFGKGSTFWITGLLPLANNGNELPEARLQGVRILLVCEKNLIQQKVFKNMLLHMGSRTTIVDDHKNVINTLLSAVTQGDPFKICIIDQATKNGSALDTGKDIRQNSFLSDLKLMFIAPLDLGVDVKLETEKVFNAYLNRLCRYESLQTVLSKLYSPHSAGQNISKQNIQHEISSPIQQEVTFNASVLLVEDVIPNQIIAKKFLQKLGVSVDIANDGQRAVELFKNKAYDLIFMDCRMPVMDGYEATRKIRQLEQESDSKKFIPVIALTANASEEDKIICQQSGMNGVVIKPFKPTDLSAVLTKWLNDT